MLDVQYRMHPAISQFPSCEFYDFGLVDGTVDSMGNICPSLAPPTWSHVGMDPSSAAQPSVIFLDHDGAESMRDRSRINRIEADIVCSVVENLLLYNQASLCL
jgi:hypothetical protein